MIIDVDKDVLLYTNQSQLKQDWLQQGQALFSKMRLKKDRFSRQLEDGKSVSLGLASTTIVFFSIYVRISIPPCIGLESIYSPIELPKPTTYSRQLSADLTLEGVKLDGDGYVAFMSIMNQWKVFGGR
jgi:hypothetical protein